MLPVLLMFGVHPSSMPAATPPKKVVRSAPALSRDTRAMIRWMRPMTLRDEVAQMVMIPFTGRPLNTRSREYRKISDLIRREHVGGMILVNVTQGRLVQKADPLEAAQFINAMQLLSRVPLLVGADLERGASMRLDPTILFPHAMAFTAGGDPEAVRFEGEVTAHEARAVGINWVFYPVLDVNSNPDNPIINIRSFGENPDDVARFGQAFIEGAHSVPGKYVLTTGKHFPGHGDTATDTHLNLATVTSDRKHLDTIEFVPFRAAIAAGVDSIMTAHLAVPALEAPDLPATLSPVILTQVLREQMGFKGIVITDALEMGGIARGFSVAEAAVRAVKAGADVLLMPRDPSAAIDAVVAAIRRGEIDRKQIQASVRRLLTAKVRVDLDISRLVDLKKIPEIVDLPENEVRAEAIAAHAVTLVKNEGNLIPLPVPTASKPSKACFIAMVESHNGKEGDVFKDQLHQIAPNAPLFTIAPDEAKVTTPSIMEAPCDTYVVAAWVSVAGYRGNVALGGDFPELLNGLIASNKPVALVSLGNPYVVRGFGGVKAYLATYSTVQPSEIAAVKAIFGQIPITGRLPVTIPEIAPYHAGIQIGN
ncbi:MAG TPA: glycoside hydrolase family 3 N-terminal domain-containing protein [Bryobacteraceae bacterium]